MRKFTSFLALVLTSILSINAQVYTTTTIESIGEQVTSLDQLEDGGLYLLWNTGRNCYIYEADGGALMQKATADVDGPGTFAITFEIASSSATDVKAYLRTASGNYFPNTEENTKLSTSSTKALYTINMVSEGVFHFTLPSGKELNGNGTGASGDGATVASWVSGDGANGKFNIYPVTLSTMSDEQIAIQTLDQAIATCTADRSSFSEDVIGGYRSDLVQKWEDAYNEATDAQIYADEYTSEELLAVAEALKSAYEAAFAERITMDASKMPTPGYYYLVSSRDTTANSAITIETAMNPLNVNAAWSDGTNALWETHFDATVQGETADAKYVWELKQVNDTAYTLRNLAFDNYIANVSPYTMGAEADAATFTIGTCIGAVGNADQGFYSIVNTAVSGVNNSLHAQVSGKKIVNWTPAALASGWYFVPVDDATVEAISGGLDDIREQQAQKERNAALSALVKTSKAAEEAGKSYNFSGTDDGQFIQDESLKGLVTSATQVYSNVKDPGEGSYEGLFDSDYTTFFHTSWHNSLQASEPHYLQIDLAQEGIDNIILKYAERSATNAQTPDLPYEVTIYGTNDASLLSGVETIEIDAETGEETTVVSEVPSTAWTNLGDYTLAWDTQLLNAEGGNQSPIATRSSAPILKGAGMAFLNINGNRYIRIAVRTNLQHAVTGNVRSNGDGFDFWNLSELRVYEAAYDPNCIYENMDATVKANLANAITKAEGELANEKASQATIDELQAAYDAFMAVYPSKSELLDLIREAKTWTTPAQVGDNAGYYPDGAAAELQGAIQTAEAAADNLTYASYTANMAALKSGIEKFIGKVVTPADGIYYILSHTTGAAKGSYVCTDGTGTTANAYSNVKWNYKNDTEISNRLNAMWELKHVDGGITLRNLATNRYLSNEQVTLSGHIAQTVDAHTLGLRSARVDTIPAALNITMYNDSVKYFANAQPGGAVMVVWSAAQGTDNSAFEFVPVNDFFATMILEHAAEATIHLLPFDISAPTEVTALTVAGIKDNAVQLVAIQGETIPAGTPFIVVEDPTIVPNFSVYLTVFDAASIVYDYSDANLSKNGFTAVWEPDTLKGNAHVIGQNLETLELALVEAAKKAVIAANEGYFVITGMPASAIDGDASIPLVKEVVDGVEKVTLGDVIVTKKGTYSLSGVKVNGKNLPKGVYIIDGKKVVK